MRIICLTKNWDHHTASGGYGRLAQKMGATAITRCRASGVLHSIIRSWWEKQSITKRYLLDYQYGDMLAECTVLARSAARVSGIAHVLYGDEQLDLLLKWRSLLRCPLIATFHLPTRRVTERFERFQKHLLSGIDAAVVVSKCQLADFRQWLNPDRVVYIPHGIDVERFLPPAQHSIHPKVRLLFVGHHMRDWKTLRRTIDECNARNLPVLFECVVKEDRRFHFDGCANVTLHTEIPESSFIKLYQDADALLLPLIDSTANNSVLESLACGTPVISSKVGGMPDYVDDTCGWLFDKDDVHSTVSLIEAFSANKDLAQSRRAAARHKSLGFSWDCIASQMQRLYLSMIDRKPPAASQNQNRK